MALGPVLESWKYYCRRKINCRESADVGVAQANVGHKLVKGNILRVFMMSPN